MSPLSTLLLGAQLTCLYDAGRATFAMETVHSSLMMTELFATYELTLVVARNTLRPNRNKSRIFYASEEGRIRRSERSLIHNMYLTDEGY